MGNVEYNWSSYGLFSGAAHAVSSDCVDEDRVEALRRVVEEVTGEPLPIIEKRIGF